jgi:hypothetical protein
MTYKFNPLIKSKFDYYEDEYSIPVQADAPANPVNGQMYVDTDDNILYIYWGSWQSTGITLTPPTPPTITSGQPIGLLLTLTYTI